MQSTPGSPSQRIPTLDGWRGVAILMVLVGHFLLGRGATSGLFFTGAFHGVAIFFVLSGYLITDRLIGRDLDNLPRFYLRRALRLWPVAWCYLAVFLAIAAAAHTNIVSRPELVACLLFFRNYVPGNLLVTAHFWTLAIEEQFYLVWPLTLVLIPRRFALPATAGIAASFALYRFCHWDAADWRRTPAHIDTLLVGCCLALALVYPQVKRAFLKHGAAMSCVGIILFAVGFTRYGAITPIFESIGVAVLIGVTSLRGNVLLDWAPLRWIGLVSYSLYVWQEPFLLANGSLAIRIPGLILATLASYFFVEKPMIRFGRSLGAATSSQPLAHPVEAES